MKRGRFIAGYAEHKLNTKFGNYKLKLGTGSDEGTEEPEKTHSEMTMGRGNQRA